jgi:hypothetical protein
MNIAVYVQPEGIFSQMLISTTPQKTREAVERRMVIGKVIT